MGRLLTQKNGRKYALASLNVMRGILRGEKSTTKEQILKFNLDRTFASQLEFFTRFSRRNFLAFFDLRFTFGLDSLLG